MTFTDHLQHLVERALAFIPAADVWQHLRRLLPHRQRGRRPSSAAPDDRLQHRGSGATQHPGRLCPAEARWNYAFWIQNQLTVVGDLTSDTGGTIARQKWTTELGRWYEEPSDPADWVPVIGPYPNAPVVNAIRALSASSRTGSCCSITMRTTYYCSRSHGCRWLLRRSEGGHAMWQALPPSGRNSSPVTSNRQRRKTARAMIQSVGTLVLHVEGGRVAAAQGFAYEERGDGSVVILHRGRVATVLRGSREAQFLREVAEGKPQLVMARWTGNYRRGNERTARQHPRNAR